jgi:hypothetical protein
MREGEQEGLRMARHVRISLILAFLGYKEGEEGCRAFINLEEIKLRFGNLPLSDF